MKGSIRERSPGRWAIILDVPDENGKRRRKWHTFHGTKREAQTECARLITAMKGGDYVEPAKTTVGQHLDRWHEHMRSQVTPRTHERYGEIIKKNLVPAIDGILLQKLGHSRVGVTLDLYSHVLPGMQEDAAARVDESLRLAVEKRASESVR